jgi:hypothetical protein
LEKDKKKEFDQIKSKNKGGDTKREKRGGGIVEKKRRQQDSNLRGLPQQISSLSP